MSEKMTYRVKPIYGSAAMGKKPIKFAVVDAQDIPVETFLYKEDAARKAKELNGKKRHLTRI